MRILIVINLPWDSRLGAPRVWMELAEQWRALGHTVEKFTLSDAFPGVRATRVTFALRQLIFIGKAKAFVRRNAHRFDVIDTLIGSLPFSKEELDFRGIVVARSVGLYRLYERFDQSVAQRWPQPTKGKLAGRFLYRFTRRRLLRASERSVRTADLINVPNEEEAACVREEMGLRNVVVQPYGLTSERRRALADASANAETRLAQRRVCFIGMWSARKGSYDWPQIIARIRRDLPETRFRFLGTMLDEARIKIDLGEAASRNVEFVSDFPPEGLPALLSDCTVGAFPSYAEGFGLAVLEQLAAGLPTVAYDVAGPRDILRPEFPEQLVTNGDIEAFVQALVRLLRLEPGTYEKLAQHSRQSVEKFSWSEIARDTIDTYEKVLGDSSRPIIFVQPFSLGWAGGGARILRALTEHAPFAWRSICTSPARPRRWRNELHIRSRPSWGRIEHSRLAALPKATMRFFARNFRHRLRRCCKKLGARAIHAVPHAGTDFSIAHEVARDLSLPFFLSVHDDLAYTAGSASNTREAAMQSAWHDAAACFVISDALGEEYCRRYGAREFKVVTDGLTSPGSVRLFSRKSLRIYFMGLFHMTYERNLRALLEGLALLEPSPNIILRCEHIRREVLIGFNHVTVLPFADEAQVQRDLESADLLYMPMPFGPENENFARYSLSTKMVTYVGSGLPILYHGPRTSAAYELLQKNRAAIFLTTLEPTEIADILRDLDPKKREEVAANALALGRREFMLADQVAKFWGTIEETLTKV